MTACRVRLATGLSLPVCAPLLSDSGFQLGHIFLTYFKSWGAGVCCAALGTSQSSAGAVAALVFSLSGAGRGLTVRWHCRTVWYELQAREWPFKSQPAEALIWQIGSGQGVRQVLATVSLGKEVNVSTSAAGAPTQLRVREGGGCFKRFIILITRKTKGRKENR